MNKPLTVEQMVRKCFDQGWLCAMGIESPFQANLNISPAPHGGLCALRNGRRLAKDGKCSRPRVAKQQGREYKNYIVRISAIVLIVLAGMICGTIVVLQKMEQHKIVTVTHRSLACALFTMPEETTTTVTEYK